MQIKNRLLIFILGSVISINSFAQRTDTSGDGKMTKTFIEATSSFQVVIAQPDANDLIFRVSLSNPNSKKIAINVLQNKDVINNLTTSKDFACYYNMNKLDDGDYSIVISDGREKVTKNISIKTLVNVNRVISFAS